MSVLRNSIYVQHNAEIAHRLSNLPGKCQNIHGHSLQITMRLGGELDSNGILEGLDFGTIKKDFREYIDTRYDHHLLLNETDPWANDIGWYNDKPEGAVPIIEGPHRLPGLMTTPGDPTTENIAVWICDWAVLRFESDGITAITIDVRETGTNGAHAKWSK
jgi:6-pyruvoyl-tetrahydropterin synthase